MSQPINMDAPQGASLLSTTFNTCQHCGAYIDLSDSRWWIYLRRNEPHPLAECEQIRQMKDRLANG
mgnify:CR=1 FL=1